MNASSSSSESKCVDCPDTTCSTRPAIGPQATLLFVRKCTTNAQCTDNGAFSACGCDIMGSLSIFRWQSRVLCVKRIRTREQKVIGRFWDYSGITLGRGESKKCNRTNHLLLVATASLPRLDALVRQTGSEADSESFGSAPLFREHSSLLLLLPVRQGGA